MTLNPVAMQPRGRGVPYNVPRGRGQSIRASPIVRGNPVARGATRVQVPQVSRGGRGILAARGVVMGQRTPMLTPQMGRGTQRPRNPGQNCGINMTRLLYTHRKGSISLRNTD